MGSTHSSIKELVSTNTFTNLNKDVYSKTQFDSEIPKQIKANESLIFSWCSCSKSTALQNSLLVLDNSVKSPISKIQSAYRGYFFRKTHPIITASKYSSYSTKSNFPKNIKEIGGEYCTGFWVNNQKIIKWKTNLKQLDLDYDLNINANANANVSAWLSNPSNPSNESRLKQTSLLYIDHTVYKGTVNHEYTREGFGTLYMSDGSIYEGGFRNNHMEGYGRMLNIDGFIYEGEYSNSKANGYGKYIGSNGTLYKGNWVNDKQHGTGDETFNDKSHYIGEFINGLREGKGEFFFNGGNYYSGEFYNNKIHGEGIYKWKDGRIYNGYWQNNKLNGYGVFYWPDGKKFYGKYIDKNKNGFGVYVWADGKRFEGFWKDGRQHGLGVLYYHNEGSYGSWHEGRQVKEINDADEKEYIQAKIDSTKKEKEYIEFDKKVKKYEKEIKAWMRERSKTNVMKRNISK